MKDNIIYILLPVHNRKVVTERFIIGLIAQTWKNYHLVLIDDGSVDGTEEMVKSYNINVTVIRGSGNWWWGGCLQHGIEWLQRNNVTREDMILIINDDVVVSPDFLKKGVEFLKTHRHTLLLAQIFDENTRQPVESGINADLAMHRFAIAKKGETINCLSTRGLLMRFYDVLEIGGFHPRILPHYGSDYEYTIRAYKKGFHLATIPSFYLKINRDKTGLHSLPDGGALEFIINVFSKRYVRNPIYRSTLIMLTSPKKRIPILLFTMWKRTFYTIFYKIKISLFLALTNLIGTLIH